MCVGVFELRNLLLHIYYNPLIFKIFKITTNKSTDHNKAKIINTASYIFLKQLLSLPTHVKHTHMNTECPDQMNDYQLLCSMELTANLIISSMWLLFFKKLSFIILLKVKVASELLTANIKHNENQMPIKATPTELTLVKQSWLQSNDLYIFSTLQL